MSTDVLVIGGGNAALCAALMAAEAGASVLLLEAAPREWRGGNSMHTRNLRCMHDAPQDVLVDAYPEEEFWQDLLKVTGGLTNERLARLAIRASSSCRDWMRRHGVRFQPPLSGALHVARTNAFFMGGGKALVNAYYRSAENLGVQVRYDAPVERIEVEDGPYDLPSLPKLLGAAGGVSLLAGTAGLWRLNRRRHPLQGDAAQKPMDLGFIALLFLTSASGLALWLARGTPALPLLLCLHLGAVMALFATLPYGKFAHGVFRSAALLRHNVEKRQPNSLGLGAD